MRIKARTLRILTQIRHDKRTLALILIAPLIILSLVYFILTSGTSTYNIGIISAPDAYVTALTDNENFNIHLTYLQEDEVSSAIKDNKIIAAVDINDTITDAKIYLDATNSLGRMRGRA